ncbi:MAG: hypothetical protein MHPSP_000890, partial [Paramarteilia canceri]
AADIGSEFAEKIEETLINIEQSIKELNIQQQNSFMTHLKEFSKGISSLESNL